MWTLIQYLGAAAALTWGLSEFLRDLDPTPAETCQRCDGICRGRRGVSTGSGIARLVCSSCWDDLREDFCLGHLRQATPSEEAEAAALTPADVFAFREAYGRSLRVVRYDDLNELYARALRARAS